MNDWSDTYGVLVTMLFILLNADGRVCPKDGVAFDSHPILEIPPMLQPPLD